MQNLSTEWGGEEFTLYWISSEDTAWRETFIGEGKCSPFNGSNLNSLSMNAQRKLLAWLTAGFNTYLKITVCFNAFIKNTAGFNTYIKISVGFNAYLKIKSIFKINIYTLTLQTSMKTEICTFYFD